MADYHLVSDEQSIVPNPAGFREHRHDQSLFSMLLKGSSRAIGHACGATNESQHKWLTMKAGHYMPRTKMTEERRAAYDKYGKAALSAVAKVGATVLDNVVEFGKMIGAMIADFFGQFACLGMLIRALAAADPSTPLRHT